MNSWLNSYFLLQQGSESLLETAYNPYLVGLSYLIAVFAAFTTLGLVGHMRTAYAERSHQATYWWLGASLTLGGGIFVMHFVGMLAFSMPLEIRYDFGMTLLSLIVAVGGAAFALAQIRGEISYRRILWGGLWMGAAVALMHYIGMASLLAPALLRYLPGLWLFSIAIAISVSWIALLLMYYVSSKNWLALQYRLLVAMLMGLAVAGMHYTGMASAQFYSGGSCGLSTDLFGITLAQQGLGIQISIIALLIFTVALLTSLFNDRLNGVLAQQNTALEEKVLQRTQELNLAKEKIELIVDSMTEGVALISEKGVIQQANHYLKVMTGLSEKELIGVPVSDLFVENTVDDDLRSLLSRLSSSMETLFNQDPETFQNLCAESPIAAMIVDGEGVILTMNQSLEALTGWKRDQLEGDTIEPLLPASIRPHHDALIKQFMSAPEARRMQGDRLLPIVAKDGSEKEVEIGLIPIRSAGQTRIVVLLHDPSQYRSWELFKISTLGRLADDSKDRMQAQYQLRQKSGDKLPVLLTIGSLNESQQQGAGESAAVLVMHDITEHIKQGHRDQYAAFQAGISEMNATVLHNIGNVLTGLNGGLNGFDRNLDTLDTVKQAADSLVKQSRAGEVDQNKLEEGLGIISNVVDKVSHGEPEDEAKRRGLRNLVVQLSEGINHAAEIIQTFREESKKEVESAPFNLYEMVGDTLDLIESRLTQSGIEVKLNISKKIEVKIPRNLTMQMLLNLLKNSYEAIKQRKNSEQETSYYIQVSAVQQGDTVLLTIEDNGCGVAQEEQSMLFERGYTTKETGSGIGLHSITNYVAGIGGEIKLHSDGINTGATIQITLPLEKKRNISKIVRDSFGLMENL